MKTTAEHTRFNDNQYGIYAKFHAAQEQIPQTGVEVDSGTALQGGILVAWRLPKTTAEQMAEYSIRLREAVPSMLYGYDEGLGLDNAHVTLSDHNLVRGSAFNLESEESQAALAGLVGAVHETLKTKGGGRNLAEARVNFDGFAHNGKTGVALGTANPEMFAIRQDVIQHANAEHGIKLSGAWGAHSTNSRVLEAFGGESDEVRNLRAILAEPPQLGEVHPSALDVGYFTTHPEHGFQYTTFERFDA
ncbi:MAG TPA: hypothetical protein VJP80_07455 [Candidatus Saccharimonadales bacterium]|nr:hypothetical protein [Candidatus Saccharimonadales bacterium]